MYMNFLKYCFFHLLTYMDLNYTESYFIQRDIHNRYLDFLLTHVKPVRSDDYNRKSNKNKS